MLAELTAPGMRTLTATQRSHTLGPRVPCGASQPTLDEAGAPLTQADSPPMSKEHTVFLVFTAG